MRLPVIYALVLVPACGQALGLSDAVHRAWDSAPLFHEPLRAEQRLLSISRVERWQRWFPNEPQFFYGNSDDRTAAFYGLNETFGFPGKAPAFSRLDRLKEEAQRAEQTAKRYELTQTVLQAYLDTAVALASVELQKRNIDDQETLASSLRARYEAGLAAQAEVIGSDLQLRQQRADLAAAEDKAKASLSRLRRLLNLDTDPQPLELPDDLDPALVGQLGPSTADESRARSAAALAQTNGELAWWSQAPDLSFSAQRNHYLYLPGSPSGRTYSTNFSVGITAPLFFPFYERTQAQRQREQARLDETAARLQWVNAEADRLEAKREYDRTRARLKEIRDRDLPMAEALMESTLSAYRTGKLGYAELTLARKTLNDLRAQDIQLRGAIINAHLRCLGQSED